MRRYLPLLLGVALIPGAAWATPLAKEFHMKSTKSAPLAQPIACDAADGKPHKGNGGVVFGPNAKANGGTGNIGKNTGNGGTAIGANADASGGDNNNAGNPCDGRARLGNGGTAVGRDAKANGGSGNVVKF